MADPVPREIVSSTMCDHLFDTTTRYDRRQKLLSFLVFCPTCGTERVVESIRYEPAFRQADPPIPHGAAR